MCRCLVFVSARSCLISGITLSKSRKLRNCSGSASLNMQKRVMVEYVHVFFTARRPRRCQSFGLSRTSQRSFIGVGLSRKKAGCRWHFIISIHYKYQEMCFFSHQAQKKCVFIKYQTAMDFHSWARIGYAKTMPEQSRPSLLRIQVLPEELSHAQG